MNEEKQQQLFKEFPVLFRKRNDVIDKKSPYWPIQTGIHCGEGWFEIIHDMCTKLQRLNELENPAEPCKIFQIKEKFGTMSFYTHHASEIQRDVIRAGEMRTCTTCEECGKNAYLRKSKMWIHTLCTEHAKASGYKLEDWET